MRPATHYLLLPLLLMMATGAEPLREIDNWTRQPESCERRALLLHLRHEDVRVRSAALDLLELITGKDFGLDPWLAPADVPQPVQQELEAWAGAEEMAGEPVGAPAAEQVRMTVGLLRTADSDTQRRLCMRYAPWRAALSAAIQKELADKAALPEKEQDNLRSSLYRLQLQQAIPANVGHVVPMLVSHARNDMLTGLEALREAGHDALPVVMSFVGATDGLVREVAVDVLLQIGGAQAYKILMPQLMAETDRNILQIALRRAPDCKPYVAIVEFLNRCALSADEDVAVAALEALGDMEYDTDDSDMLQFATAKQALPTADFVALLSNPNWRVRAAALQALRSTAPFVPAVRDKELRAAIIHALREDTDDTVRANAMTVLHKRKLAITYMQELTDYAVRTPSATPYVVYMYCQQGTELTPALLDAVTRFSPDQVERLAAYEAEYQSVFREANLKYKSVMAVLEALLANPDPRVRRRVVEAWGAELFVAYKPMAAAFLEWVKDPAVSAVEKITPLSHLVEYGVKKADRENESVVALCDWLQQEVNSPTIQDEALQNMMYVALLMMRPAVADTMLDERIEKVEPGYVDDLLEAHPEYFLKFRREYANKILKYKYLSSFSDLIRVDDKYAPQMFALLATLELQPEHRQRLLEQEIAMLEEENGILTPEKCPAIYHAVSPEASEQNRIETLFMLAAQNQAQKSPFVEAIAGLAEPWATHMRCLLESPRKAEDVEPWARKYYKSELPHVRRAVAGCLLPADSWMFSLPRGENEAPLLVKAPVARRFPEGKRVSCPTSLIRLVQSMQADDDPFVALVACGSLLYRTGDCDRARLQDLLKQMQENKKKLEAQDGNLDAYRELGSQLEGVWRRWYDFRSSVEEFYKLKGSPKKLRPGLPAVLQQLADAIDDYPWSVIDEVKDLLPKRSSSSGSKSTDAQPHEFDYPVPSGVAQADAAKETAAAEPEADAAETGDAEEQVAQPRQVDMAAPVRVEFFHKAGCDVCERVERRLNDLKSTYPGLEVVAYDVESEVGRERNTVLCGRFGVEPRQRRKAPALFAEAGVLLGEEAASGRLDALVKESLMAGVHDLRLTASPAQTEEPQVPAVEAPEPTETASSPTPVAPSDKLAESSASEVATASGEQFWERLRSYGMLAIGALVALLGALLVFFDSRSRKEND